MISTDKNSDVKTKKLFYIGDQSYEFSDEDFDFMYENEGQEAVIYRFCDRALKIYKDYCWKDRLSEEDAQRLSKISSTRIVLPKELIYDRNRKFCGYSRDFYMSYAISHIANMDMEDFLKELDLIYRDVEVLSENKVSIDDLDVGNFIYDGQIRIIDPGSYCFLDSADSKVVMRDNLSIVREFVLEGIIIPSISLTKRQKLQLKSYFPDDFYIGDIMKWDVSDQKRSQSVKNYVKQICK